MIPGNAIPKRAIYAVGMYATCLAAAGITEILGTVPGSGISIWLPAGFLLAAALASPRGSWPIWAAAAIAAEFTGNLLWYRHAIGPASILAFGNAFAALTGALIIQRLIKSRPYLVTIKGAAVFLVVAIVAMPLMSATTGSIALGLSYGRPWFDAWIRIYLGDATGAALAAPLGLLVFKAAAPKLVMFPQRWTEAAALLIVFIVMSIIALGGLIPFAFLLIPPLLWAALSFRMPGAICAIVSVTCLSLMFTVGGLGSFAQTEIYTNVQNEALQLFLIVVSTTGLSMGALAEENRQNISRLHVANRTLEDRVAERSASLLRSEADAREAANLLSAIGEACSDMIYAKDLNFQVIYANSATLKTLGVDNFGSLQAQSEADLYEDHDEFDAVHDIDRQVLETQTTIVIEEAVTNRAGERRIYRTSKSPLYDGDGNLAGLAGVSVDISNTKKAQARETMLVREVEHRARNLLAVVQGIVQLAGAETVPEFKTKLSKRIRALAQTNGAIAASNWNGASIAGLLDAELAPYRDEIQPNVILSGEDVMLDPTSAQSLTLVIHELATNAAKYGCLSTERGQLSVDWKCQSSSPTESVLAIAWVETGGPPTRPPERKGFGTMVITAFGQEKPGSDVTFLWKESGVTVNIAMPLNRACT